MNLFDPLATPTKRRLNYGLMAGATLLLAVAPLQAQDANAPANAPTAAPAANQTELDALRAEITALQARLDKLESAQPTPGTSGTPSGTAGTPSGTNAAPAAATTPVVSKLPVTVSGLLQVNARAYGDQSGPAGRSYNTLQLRRGEIRLTGGITDRISGTIMFDPAKQTAATSTSTVNAKTGAVTTTVTPTQSANPLQDLIVSYLLNKTPSNTNSIDIGQYKIPIGYEGDLVSSSAIPTVDRALMYQARDPFGGGNGDIRDTGVRLHGTAGALDYQAGVYNGLGERQNALAAGTGKAFIGRLMYSPASVPGLALGISGGDGDTSNISGPGNSKVRRNIYNAFVNYGHDKFSARAEYLTGKNQVLVSSTGGGPNRDIRSYYGLLGYSFTKKIELVGRYDYFDFAHGLVPAAGKSSDSNVTEATLGLNYYIRGNNAKIQANIVRRNGGAGLIGANGFSSNGTSFGNSSTQLRTNFQIAF